MHNLVIRGLSAPDDAAAELEGRFDQARQLGVSLMRTMTPVEAVVCLSGCFDHGVSGGLGTTVPALCVESADGRRQRFPDWLADAAGREPDENTYTAFHNGKLEATPGTQFFTLRSLDDPLSAGWRAIKWDLVDGNLHLEGAWEGDERRRVDPESCASLIWRWLSALREDEVDLAQDVLTLGQRSLFGARIILPRLHDKATATGLPSQQTHGIVPESFPSTQHHLMKLVDMDDSSFRQLSVGARKTQLRSRGEFTNIDDKTIIRFFERYAVRKGYAAASARPNWETLDRARGIEWIIEEIERLGWLFGQCSPHRMTPKQVEAHLRKRRTK